MLFRVSKLFLFCPLEGNTYDAEACKSLWVDSSFSNVSHYFSYFW